LGLQKWRSEGKRRKEKGFILDWGRKGWGFRERFEREWNKGRVTESCREQKEFL
jgi:hypothetical protein